jgi:hypothetical protein
MSETEFPLSRRNFVAAGVAASGIALTATFAHSQTGSPTMQATIRADGQVITLVNVFTVEAASCKTCSIICATALKASSARCPVSCRRAC